MRQVARELGVRYVLEGSVRKAGNRVRITGQLIDAATGTHLWADRFDGGLEDIFELQDQVASRVVGAIEPRLRLSEGDRVSRKPTENLDAYDLYLRALAQMYKMTEESVAEAIRLAAAPLNSILPLLRPWEGLPVGGKISFSTIGSRRRVQRSRKEFRWRGGRSARPGMIQTCSGLLALRSRLWPVKLRPPWPRSTVPLNSIPITHLLTLSAASSWRGSTGPTRRSSPPSGGYA